MRLLESFLDWVHDGFSRSPQSQEAIYIRTTDDTVRVTIDDNVLNCAQGGFVVLSLVVNGFTIQGVVDELTGIFPSTILTGDYAEKSARILLAPRRFYDQANGQYVFVISAYQSILYALLDMFATQCESTIVDIKAMLEQAYFHLATDYWLDEWGSYFGIRRNNAETDDFYRRRIVASLIKQPCNNIAMELAIEELFQQSATVEDIEESPTFFRASIGFDLLGSESPDGFAAQVTDFINSVKAAGTLMDSFALLSSDVSDDLAASRVHESLPISVGTAHRFNGAYRFDGTIQYQPTTVSEVL